VPIKAWARAESIIPETTGTCMSKKAPKGEEKKAARKSVDWKALEIVHPDAAASTLAVASTG
jgi:hypothetical protein